MIIARALPLPSGPFLPFSPPPLGPQSSAVKRRTTPEQGRALEVLGHAVEYLVDSHLVSVWDTPADAEAVHLLMACSRAVFAGAEEVCPWRLRLQKALFRRLHLESSYRR